MENEGRRRENRRRKRRALRGWGNSMRRFCLAVLLAAAVSGCSKGPEAPQAQKAANVTAERLLNASNEPSQWMTYNGDYNEQRYSRLNKITTENVGKLGLAWYADFPT